MKAQAKKVVGGLVLAGVLASLGAMLLWGAASSANASVQAILAPVVAAKAWASQTYAYLYAKAWGVQVPVVEVPEPVAEGFSEAAKTNPYLAGWL